MCVCVCVCILLCVCKGVKDVHTGLEDLLSGLFSSFLEVEWEMYDR